MLGLFIKMRRQDKKGMIEVMRMDVQICDASRKFLLGYGPNQMAQHEIHEITPSSKAGLGGTRRKKPKLWL